MAKTVRSAKVTSSTKRSAVGSALSQKKGQVIRVSPGQKSAITGRSVSK